MRRAMPTLVLALAVAGGGLGCSDLHYFDVNVTFTGFGTTSGISTIETCHVYVTGADTANFYVIRNCPPFPDPNSSMMGIFEYSSNADSGTMNFKMQVYNGIPDGDTCLFGEGTVSIPIGATTVTGDLRVSPNGRPGC